MKKYRIKDEDGSTFEVEEFNDEDIVEGAKEETIAVSLTNQEFLVLKELLKIAPKVIELINQQKVDEKEEIEEEIKSEDALEEEKDDKKSEEEVIETKTKDAKTSYGSLTKQTKTVDSIDANEEIESAWTKRYGGVK